MFNRTPPPSGFLAIALAALPALPLVAIFWALGRLIVETNDEYQRLLTVKRTLLATGLTLSFTTIGGFLEVFQQVPRIQIAYVATLWCAMLIVGGLIVRLRG
jgi:hypothetical protein